VGVVLTHARFVLWSGGQEYLKQYPIKQWAWYEFPLFSWIWLPPSARRVFFFFILSGFFLQYSGRKNFSVGSFLHARFLRLYPAYLAAILAALAVFYLVLAYINPLLATASGREFNVLLHKAAADLSWTSLGHTLFFVSRDSAFAATHHFWSMLHEVVFCLLFPVYHRLSVRGRVVLAGVVLVVGWMVNSLVIQSQLFFLLGMLFYDCLARGYRLPYRFPKWAYLVAWTVPGNLRCGKARSALAGLPANGRACLPVLQYTDAALADTLWHRVRDLLPAEADGAPAVGLYEQFRFYRYDVGERFNRHKDGRIRQSEQVASRWTLLLYLNEGFVGGETEFDTLSVAPRRGVALGFRHELRHKGCPIIEGRKYVLRTDVQYLGP
jgi:peptidoglycan/LPS O-acetylase OafA/YrhL